MASDDEHRREILQLIEGAPPLSVDSLAERSGLDTGEARRLIDAMIADGTLRQEGDRLIAVEPGAWQGD
jgi:DNA-binding IclR family transcriptional regulator